MNVLWITNIVFPEAEQLLLGNGVLKSSGGWMIGAAEQLIKHEDINLTVAAVSKNCKELTCLKGERINYFLIPFGKGNTHFNKEYEKYWKQIKNQISPDIVHIHGTEFSHGLAYVKACGSNKVVVSIQGLLSSCYRYYLGGIPAITLLRNITPRDIIRCNNTISCKRSFKTRSKYEIELLQNVQHVIGRTSWDKAHVLGINPTLQYHVCNEILRQEFYSDSWEYSKCNKHSIFLSQASYPLKGLHQVISALPLVLSRYPDTIVRIAGTDITLADNIIDRLKINDYGNYIKRLIKRLGLKDHVFFTGPLTSVGMKNEYLKANLFICPSSVENSPNSLGEAQLLGCPVLASYVGGIPDMMKGNESNLYRFEDTIMLAHKICEIFELEGVQTNMREEAFRRHNPRINSETLLNMYHEIAII